MNLRVRVFLLTHLGGRLDFLQGGGVMRLFLAVVLVCVSGFAFAAPTSGAFQARPDHFGRTQDVRSVSVPRAASGAVVAPKAGDPVFRRGRVSDPRKLAALRAREAALSRRP